MDKTLVKVVVPVYKEVLSELEYASLRQTVMVLKGYPIVLLKPHNINIDHLIAEFPSLEIQSVSTDWIGVKNGIAGYNRMMLSAEFYNIFADTEYILICHVDAWIFRDELTYWCERGYDCVAAPWVRRGFYNYPLIKQYMSMRRLISKGMGAVSRQIIYDKVGNGGLSLRRVEPFSAACVKYKKEIEIFLSVRYHLYNEDVFFALVPREFRYPTVDEALRFAFDTNPVYCYNRCGGHLPFGCHGWSKPKMHGFWGPIIGY